MKNLLIDIGNTNIVIGYYDNSKKIVSFRIATDQNFTEDEYFLKIRSLLKDCKINLQKIDSLALSSVVPVLTKTFSHLRKKYFPKTRLINISHKSPLGLSFGTKKTSHIGADLLMNAYAAKKKYNRSCIICDFGTATTIQLVSKDGFFWGGAIVPGVITSAKTLFDSATELSQIELKKSEKIISLDTTEALRAGIINGSLFLVEGFIKEIKKKFASLDIFTIATGGLAQMICADSSLIDKIDKDLILDGLDLICSKGQVAP